MITQVKAKNFRCLHDINQTLDHFHILIGPNASGKTTFLDVLALLGRLVSHGLEATISERTHNLADLLWKKSGTYFELAIEAKIPSTYNQQLLNQGFDKIRYVVVIGMDERTDETSILVEQVSLIGTQEKRLVINKDPNQHDHFYSETSSPSKTTPLHFKLGPRRSALGNLPEDDSQFPVTIWLKNLLTNGTQPFILNSHQMRQPSPPGQPRFFKPDGSNLPWIIDTLYQQTPNNYQEWISHLQTALDDLEDIRTIIRPEDRHRYLVIRFKNGLEIPSWMASDGTLRLLALTLLAYLPDISGIYLIEEPENGIHPSAVETVYQSLSSVYDAQILLATHSPVILGLAQPHELLCFVKNSAGATNIIKGDQHPALKHWLGETNLGVLFAGGVLG